MKKITALLILFCVVAVIAQGGKQNVAVYMAGKEPVGAKGAHKILGSELAKAITNSDTYSAVDRTDAVLKQIEKEHQYQRSGAVSDEQIKALGKQLGVSYLCIAEISEVKGGAYFLEARLVDVEKATVLKIASVNSTLKDNKEIVSAGQRVARGLITGKSTEEIFSDFREDKVGIDMIFVEGGTFLMGCTSEQGTDCEDNERPVHSVTVSDFYIGKYPITQKQWKKVMGNNPSFDKGDDLPVQKISWYDAQTFIKELNTITGKKYRLPTEAEWEYAARGGVKSNGHKYSGSSLIDKVAWYIVNSGDKTLDDGYMDSLLSTYNADRFLQILKSNKNITHPVGTKQPNELSIYDMSGNGEEWVEDKYGNYSPSPQINPIGLSSSGRVVIRGCAVASNAKDCRVSKRFGIFPVDSANGFRLAMSAKIVEVYTTKKVEDDIMKSAEEFI